MEYAIKEIARVIGAKTNQLLDDTVSLLLTDSRRLSFPEQSLFFALKIRYGLYKSWPPTTGSNSISP